MNNKQERDPLTDAIFGTLSDQESILVPRGEEDELTRAIFASLDYGDPRQANLGFPEEPSTIVPEKVRTVLADDRESLLRELESVDPLDLADLERTIVLRPLAGNIKTEVQLSSSGPEDTSQDVARAEDNWFSVHTADLSHQNTRFVQEIEETKSSWVKRITLAVAVFAFVGTGAYAAIETNLFSLADVVSNRFFSVDQESFLGAQSFVLLNAEEDLGFAPLFLLHKNIKEKEDELLALAALGTSEKDKILENTKKLEDIKQDLDRFFGANENFSWVNMFLPPEEVTIDAAGFSYPTNTEILTTVLQRKINLEKAAGIELGPDNTEIQSYIEWLNFWADILSVDKNYLVLSTHPKHKSPAGGEPYNYVLLSTKEGALSIDEAASVEDLNAAMVHKIIPPEPVRTVKTNFDFLEAGWFLATEEFANLSKSFYEDTTGQNVNGVLLVSYELLEELNKKQGFNFNPDSPDWMAKIFSTLLRRPINWQVFKNSLKQATLDKRLLPWFVDRRLDSFVAKNDLGINLGEAHSKDKLSVGIRSWEGGDLETETIEYSPEFFVDGSVVSKLSLFLRNGEDKDTRAYIKFYLAEDSTVLSGDGFSDKPTLPVFDYASNGFLAGSGVDELSFRVNETPQFDFFKEGNFFVVGAWIDIPASSRKTVSINYKLATRLDWQKGEDSYTFSFIKPGFSGEIPFRFSSNLGEGIGFSWVKPQGFLSDSLAELQTILRGDLELEATISFEN